MVIQFYEERLSWHTSSQDEDEWSLNAERHCNDRNLERTWKSEWDEDFHFFPSCSSRSCHCSAVRSLWPVQCDAEHIFHAERSQPTIVLLACEEQFPNTWSLFLGVFGWQPFQHWINSIPIYHSPMVSNRKLPGDHHACIAYNCVFCKVKSNHIWKVSSTVLWANLNWNYKRL